MRNLYINVLLLLMVMSGYAITLSWCPNTNSDLVGYKIYYGNGNITNWTPSIIQNKNTNTFCGDTVIQSGSNWLRNYTSVIYVGKNTSLELTNLIYGTTYYFALTSINTNEIESEYSNEERFIATLPSPPQKLIISNIQYNKTP